MIEIFDREAFDKDSRTRTEKYMDILLDLQAGATICLPAEDIGMIRDLNLKIKSRFKHILVTTLFSDDNIVFVAKYKFGEKRK